MSPPAAVLLMAPAKVLHGAVRLQELASCPTPDTHVRVGWAWPGIGSDSRTRRQQSTGRKRRMRGLQIGWVPGCPADASGRLFCVQA
jgi:hypothetical protein